ncbi:Transcriptional regulatory protein RXT2 N-terminal domain-containing protein [[Candida] zeylanoides]
MDDRSLQTIARFKESLAGAPSAGYARSGTFANRGAKAAMPDRHCLVPKVVEYEGHKRLVLTNDAVEHSARKRRRRWRRQYGSSDADAAASSESSTSSAGSSDESDGSTGPYDLELAEILSPLAHPSEIVSHPAVSKTYRSAVFGKMAYELIELIELEQANLNWLNKLVQVLNGEDWFYMLEENMGLPSYDHGLNEDEGTQPGVELEAEAPPAPSASAQSSQPQAQSQASPETSPEALSEAPPVSTEASPQPKPPQAAEAPPAPEAPPSPPPKRITRTTALSETDREEDPFFALPEALRRYEAMQTSAEEPTHDDMAKEELVNYLQVSIQRQQEYIKNLSQLRMGLVRADRLKSDLWKWGKEMYETSS